MKSSKLGFYDKFTVLLTNMKLNDIPTQNSRLYVRLKQCYTKKSTKPVQITDNSVRWNEDIDLKCTLPKTIKKEKKKYLLNLSFRFENPSGHGFVRYGNANIDLFALKINKEHHFEVPLEQCVDKSTFIVDIINCNPFDYLSSPNEAELNTSVAVNEAYSPVSSFSIPNSVSSETVPTEMSVSESSQYTNEVKDAPYFIPPVEREVKVVVFDNISVNIKESKMKEFEKQVDGIVAQIINNSY